MSQLAPTQWFELPVSAARHGPFRFCRFRYGTLFHIHRTCNKWTIRAGMRNGALKRYVSLLLYIRARFHCSWHRNMICTTALSVTHSPTEVSLLVPPGTSLPLRKVSLGALGGHLYPLVHLPLFPRRILKALAIGHQVPKLVLLRLS